MKKILFSILFLGAWQWSVAQENAATDNAPECVMLTISGNPATHRAVSWRTEVGDTVSLAELVQLRPSPDLAEHAKRVQGNHALWEDGGIFPQLDLYHGGIGGPGLCDPHRVF